MVMATFITLEQAGDESLSFFQHVGLVCSPTFATSTYMWHSLTAFSRAIVDLKLSQDSPRRQDASVFVQCPVLDALRKKRLLNG